MVGPREHWQRSIWGYGWLSPHSFPPLLPPCQDPSGGLLEEKSIPARNYESTGQEKAHRAEDYPESIPGTRWGALGKPGVTLSQG